jgi:UDP-2,3-diacylglucosamine pyrophosphatase LpxH
MLDLKKLEDNLDRALANETKESLTNWLNEQRNKICTTDLIVIGDLHGMWNTLFYYIKQLELNDTTIIVAGDCGFGFEKPEYYTQTYNKFKKYLLENNVHILFIRGNHDDPSYFNGENTINLPNFRTLKDYTVLDFNDKKILCVGGGVSIDRITRTLNKSYWYGEEFVFNAELMPVEPITHIITHVFFALPQLCKNELVKEFSKEDNKLILALDIEKKNVEFLLNFIKEKGWDIKHWYFGHYHMDLDFLYEGIECSCIDMLQYKHKLSYILLR